MSVLNHAELAERFGVAHEEVKAKLLELGWRFHEDSSGGLWAKPQDGDLGRL
ncbi:MAG: hypothetical protein O7C67_02225 [Gammaproteobacteria bacterium]|nr:hypothetical protein [Gammaproteobacteria bacterium]